MKLFSVTTIDVLGVANGTYSFAKGPELAHDRVLILGGPGSGKTRFLELIIAARSLLAIGERSIEEESFIRPENQSCKVILSWQLTSDEQATIGAASPIVPTEVIFRDDEEDEVDARMRYLMERYGHDDETPKFEYFSEQRRLDVGGGGTSLDEEDQLFLRTFPGPRKCSWVPSLLAELADEPSKAARFSGIMDRLSGSCTYDHNLQQLTSRGRPVRNLGELSASEADAVMFAATATLVGLSGSIILIDRPELHGLEPARALTGLSALGTDNQLLMATSSAAFAAGFDGAIVKLGSSTPSSNQGPG